MQYDTMPYSKQQRTVPKADVLRERHTLRMCVHAGYTRDYGPDRRYGLNLQWQRQGIFPLFILVDKRHEFTVSICDFAPSTDPVDTIGGSISFSWGYNYVGTVGQDRKLRP